MSNKKTPAEGNFTEISNEQLITDFKTVMTDVETLIKVLANQGGEAFAAVRAKAEASLSVAKAKMSEAEKALLVRTKATAKATDMYVHEKPWEAIGISVGLALFIGFLFGRR